METKKKVPELRFKGFSGEWEEKRFKDIVSILSGGTSIKPEDYQERGIRTIPKGAINSTGVAELSGCKFISKRFFECNYHSKASTGELVTSLRDLVPSAPNMGRIVRIEGSQEDFLMPQGVYKIELIETTDYLFVIAFSNSNKYRKIISREKNGSTQVHIRNNEFLNIEFSIPEYPEQSRIGTWFQHLDQLITLHQKKYNKLTNIKKAMLEKMFPKNGADVPEIRFEGFEGKWEEKRLGEIAIIKTGFPFDSKDFTNNGKGEYLVITNGNIQNESPYVDNTIGNKIDINNEFIKSEYVLNIYDILVTMDGTVGRTAKVIEQKQILAQRVGRLTALLEPEFLYQLLNTGDFYRKMVFISNGGTIKHISLSDISSYVAIIPRSREEQQKIGTYFQKLDQLITLQQTQIDKLKTIKKACLEKMFV